MWTQQKRRFVFSATVCIVVMAAASAIIFWPAQHGGDFIDLGSLRPGQTKSSEVTIKNTTDTTWHIVGKQASCGCTTVGDLPSEVAPHSSVPWTLSVRAPAHVGYFKTDATVMFQGRNKLTVELRGVCDAPINGEIELSDVKADAVFRESVEVAAVAGIKVDTVSSSNPAITVVLLNSAKGGQAIEFGGCLHEPGAKVESTITCVRSDGRFESKVVVTVKPIVIFQPTRLFVSNVTKSTPAIVRFSSPYSSEVQIESITDPLGICRATVEPAAGTISVRRTGALLGKDLGQTELHATVTVGGNTYKLLIPVFISDL